MIELQKRISVHSGSRDEAVILKTLLESFSIQAYEDSSLMSVFNPWGIMVGVLNAVKIRVTEADYEKAKIIIDNYNSGLYNL